MRGDLPEDQTNGHVPAPSSAQVLRLGEGLTGLEAEQDLGTGLRSLRRHRPQTAQETIRIPHRPQVHHAAPVLHDAPAAVHSEAARSVGEAEGGRTGRRQRPEPEQERTHDCQHQSGDTDTSRLAAPASLAPG